jgi:hypothetical protein
MPTTAATPTPRTRLPWPPSTHSPSGGTTGPSALYVRTLYSKGGVMSEEPPLWLLSLFWPVPLWTLFHLMLQTVFCLMLWTLFHLPLQTLPCPSIRLSNRLEHLSALAGMCYAIRSRIIVDTYGHMLLGSYWLVYKVSPSVGIPILSSLQIPPLGV